MIGGTQWPCQISFHLHVCRQSFLLEDLDSSLLHIATTGVLSQIREPSPPFHSPLPIGRGVTTIISSPAFLPSSNTDPYKFQIADSSHASIRIMEMTRHIIVVSKLDYLATYNAMETLLIHHDLSNNHSFEELVLELKHEGVLKGTGKNIRKPKK
ncbi:uncharacterized protein LOC122010051 isoform X2 [Zingiber officinale]|uniref:uncharacterized protein LOC122010051 isoform X2 n=1 Tax=Zingiber officinale TaxID=94328 RepID=UPI001C4B31F9|nr:uncharacterized protein LOC122010051 isoform X2 [Zingiber officinale]